MREKEGEKKKNERNMKESQLRRLCSHRNPLCIAVGAIFLQLLFDILQNQNNMGNNNKIKILQINGRLKGESFRNVSLLLSTFDMKIQSRQSPIMRLCRWASAAIEEGGETGRAVVEQRGRDEKKEMRGGREREVEDSSGRRLA